MKRYGLLCVLLLAGSAFALPLSKEAQSEAQLFTDFLEAAYAQRAGDPARFELLQRALSQSPDSAYLKQQLVSEALVVDNVKLAQAYIDFIDQAQDDPEAWVVYGAYQWRTEHPAQALQAYEKALELDPDDERILFQYISVLASADPHKAEERLVELARSRPAIAPELYNEIGQMYLFHQQYPKALEAFNKAVELEGTNPQFRLGRVAVYERTSQYFLMLHELEELEKMGYVTAQTLTQMASIFVMVKDFSRAQEYFLRAKKLENGNLPANYFLALFAEQAGQYDQAIVYLQDSSDYKTSSAKQLQVAFYQQKLGQEKQSLATLKHAQQQFPDEVEPTYFYAVALYDQGAYPESARVLAPLVERFSKNQEVRLQYAFALEAQHHYRAMEEQLRTLLEQNPRHAYALNLWAYSLAMRAERLDEAADYIARALAVNPEEYSFIDTQAWVYFKQGKYAQAADVISAIPEDVLAENAEMAYHAAYIYQALKDNTKAKHFYELGCGGKSATACLKEFKKIR